MTIDLHTPVHTSLSDRSLDISTLQISEILELSCTYNIHWYISLTAASRFYDDLIKSVMVMTNSPNRGIRIACSPYAMTVGRYVWAGEKLAIGYGHTEPINSFRIITPDH